MHDDPRPPVTEIVIPGLSKDDLLPWAYALTATTDLAPLGVRLKVTEETIMGVFVSVVQGKRILHTLALFGDVATEAEVEEMEQLGFVEPSVALHGNDGSALDLLGPLQESLARKQRL